MIAFQATKCSMRTSEGLSSRGAVFFLMGDWLRDTVQRMATVYQRLSEIAASVPECRQKLSESEQDRITTVLGDFENENQQVCLDKSL